MAPGIDLVYFPGCPNVDQARSNLREALAQAGVDTGWREWSTADPTTPECWRLHPSPTVLIDGRDIVGDGILPAAPACRVGGLPSIERIRDAVTAARVKISDTL